MEITYDNLLEIILEASTRLHTDIKKAFDEERLDNYLQSIGMDDLIPAKEEGYDTFPHGKVLIIGDSKAKKREIIGCCESLGIDRDRLVMKLDYNEAESYNYKALQYSPNTRLVLVGPIPHSTKDKGKHSSVINMMEETDGYPKIIRMVSGNELKITKSNIKSVLEEEIKSGYLTID